MPAGYCASGCDECPAGGVCVELLAGVHCLAGCATDAECRTDEGYFCDPLWKACVIPNTTALVPQACPAPHGAPRDPGFATPSVTGLEGHSPSAILDSDGTLLVSTVQGDQLAVARPGGIRVLVAGDAGRIARDRSGVIFAITRTPTGIALARSTDHGTTFGAPSAVHDPLDCATGDCEAPTLVLGPDPARRGGEILYVAYVAEGGVRVRASRDRGVTFGRTLTPLVGGRGELATSADGRLHVLALRGTLHGAYGSADQRVEYAASSDGGASFARPVVVSGREDSIPFHLSNPSIAVDDRRGFLYATYARGNRSAVWDVVIAVSKDKGMTWQRTRLGDDPACALHALPNLAVDPTTGTLHVAWYETSGDHGQFAHATCAAGGLRCARRGAISATPIDLATTPASPRWPGTHAALIVDDARRRLHAVWVASGVAAIASAKL